MIETLWKDRIDTDIIASVYVNVSPAHLNHTFDYAVPADLVDKIKIGSLVKLRFAANTTTGIVRKLHHNKPKDITLKRISGIVGLLPVTNEATLELLEQTAKRWACTFHDLQPIFIPPRTISSEKKISNLLTADTNLALLATSENSNTQLPDWAIQTWKSYPEGEKLLQNLQIGKGMRAVFSPIPNAETPIQWAYIMAAAAAATILNGKNVLLLTPNITTIKQLEEIFLKLLPKYSISVLHSYHSGQSRYDEYLKTLYGQSRIILGIKSAALAPVANLGLVGMWDEADPSWLNIRTPYFHTRDILALRCLWQAKQQNSPISILLGGYQHSVTVAGWLDTNWADLYHPIGKAMRANLPHIALYGEVENRRYGAHGLARIPPNAWQTIKNCLQIGPVLVQVPLGGYAPRIRCNKCGEIAKCPKCLGPLEQKTKTDFLSCNWCATLCPNWKCVCGNESIKAARIGSERTVEELGKAFPNVKILASGLRSHQGIIRNITDEKVLVVATPGAEPIAPTGYAGVIVLDAHIFINFASLDATVEASRKWMNIASMVRPRQAGGQLVIVGQLPRYFTNSLLRYDGLAISKTELENRKEAGLPPYKHMLSITGTSKLVKTYLAQLPTDTEWEILGPADYKDESRALVRPQFGRGKSLIALTYAMRIKASIAGDKVRFALDPLDLY